MEDALATQLVGVSRGSGPLASLGEALFFSADALLVVAERMPHPASSANAWDDRSLVTSKLREEIVDICVTIAQYVVQPIDSFVAAALGDTVSGVDTCPSTSTIPSAILFYGCMEFDLGGMQALGPLMPPFMLADAHNGSYPGLAPIFTSMKNEICSGRIGFAGILARPAEVMAAMIVRGWVECGCDNASGLVAALRDPRLARAILALHRQPGRDWSVEELAAECNISRSAFAGRFQSTIGIPPLRYAGELRMRLASQWLSRDRIAIDTVAQRLGYTSQAAFSRAYKRVTGHPPGASRKINLATIS